MPGYIKGVELTQDGMRAIFERMGHQIASGLIYNENPEVRLDILHQQGFMPILTGVSPTQESGHWILLIKGQDNQYYLFDPLGENSGNGYKSILARKLPQGATLSVIPNATGLNMGLCGYWVASAGVRAHTALTGNNPPTLEALGQTITQEMQQELAGNGYGEITAWLRAVAQEFPSGPPQTNATALRQATTQELQLKQSSQFTLTNKKSSVPDLTSATDPEATLTPWNGFSLYTDTRVKEALKYAFTHYLSQEYTGTVEAAPAKMGKNGDKIVNRPIHGLTHTLRTMACAEVIVEEARKAKLRGEPLRTFADQRTIADVTPDELKKIMIALAFFVTGREDEESMLNYQRYHEPSKEAFLDYVQANQSTLIPHVFSDQDEVQFYAGVIEDKNHQWEDSPAHVLINKAHMVDLLRVKQPVESYWEHYFNSLQPWIGTMGSEAVFAKQRTFFDATYEMNSSFDCNNTEPHLVVSTNKLRYVVDKKGNPLRMPPQEGERQGLIKFVPPSYQLQKGERFKFRKGGLGRYVIGADGQPIRNEPNKNSPQGSLAFFPASYTLQKHERWMSIAEYLKQEKIQSRFPGANKQLQRGRPELSEYDYLLLTNSEKRAQCENDVDYCLGQLQAANQQSKITPIKQAMQTNKNSPRKKANGDEIAAAQIIRHILAKPEVIANDHVLLHGQRFEEAFFRELLAKCDMGIVGSLLTNDDIKNIDRLMQHEQETEFHPTTPGEPAKKLGETWDRVIRQGGGVFQIKTDLIFLMQNDSWYYSRVNAIAQNRDQGSTFKEVLITALMTPLTRKALVDTNRATPPQTLFRGLNLSDTFKDKLIAQTQKIIANTNLPLFNEPDVETYKQIKLNNYTQISARINASTSTNIAVPRDMFDSNTIFELLDPDSLLHPKQVGRHTKGSESEYSVSLPENVALIPIKFTVDGQTTTGSTRHIFTCVAVQSPDFTPRHESGFALGPYINMYHAKVARLITAINPPEADQNLDSSCKSLYLRLVEQSHLPIRGGFLDRILHYFSGKDDQKISLARKAFLNDTVIPVLQQCNIALRLNNMDLLQQALLQFPSAAQWAPFRSNKAKTTKQEMDNLKLLIEQKIARQPLLQPLQTSLDALAKQQLDSALTALSHVPGTAELNKMQLSNQIKEELQQTKQELIANLPPLQQATITPAPQNTAHVTKRYQALVSSIHKKISDLDKVNPDSLKSIKKKMADVNALQEEISLLHKEQALLHSDTTNSDLAEITKLEEQQTAMHRQLYDVYAVKLGAAITNLEQEKPKNLPWLKAMVARFNERLAEAEQVQQEKIKKLNAAKEPLDLADIESFKSRLQQVNQSLVNALTTTIKVSLNQMEVSHFEEQEKEAQQNLHMLKQLAATLDDSDNAQQQKENIIKLNEFFAEKQRAYPAMVQLQLKSETLMLRLRELCEAHQLRLAATRKTRTTELTKNRWIIFQYITDAMKFTTDERITLANQEKTLTQFKNDLNNENYDLKALINYLALKSPDELAAAIGITTTSAEKLHTLFKQLNHSTTFVAKIAARSTLIDSILIELDKLSLTPEVTQLEQQPEHTVYGI